MNITSIVLILAFLVILAIAVFLLTAFLFIVVRPWIRTFFHGLPVSIIRIIAMRLRGNSPSLLIDCYIALKRANISTTIEDVEHIYMDAKNRIRTSDDLLELVTGGAHMRPRTGRTWR